jgi:hypothetical protein
VLAVQLEREARLDDLPLERPLVALDVEVADELLRDRRASLDGTTRLDVVDGGAGDALEVDPAVLIEPAVLDRHRRLCHPGARLREAHRLAVLLSRNRPEQ